MNSIDLIKGDTAFYKFQRQNDESQNVLPQAISLTFTLYSKQKKIIVKTLEDMVLDAEGFYHLVFSAEETAMLIPKDFYYYKIKVETEYYKQTIAVGNVNVLP